MKFISIDSSLANTGVAVGVKAVELLEGAQYGRNIKDSLSAIWTWQPVNTVTG